MELPAYHLPTLGNVLRSMWERGWSFIKKAGTIILLSTIVIWAGSTFGYVDGAFTFSTEMELENSVLGIIGGAICWIFSPLGFGEITGYCGHDHGPCGQGRGRGCLRRPGLRRSDSPRQVMPSWPSTCCVLPALPPSVPFAGR